MTSIDIMDLTPYVDNLRRALAVAAEAGGDQARALAERLTAPLESAARLALLEALSAASDEITRDLAPGSVEVRLRGRDPAFVVTAPPAHRAAAGAGGLAGGPEPSSLTGALGSALEVTMGVRPAVTSPSEGDEGSGTSRITLRLPDHLKPRIDEAASRMGLSVNAWLVRAVSAALGPGEGPRPGPGGGQQFGRSFTGWVR
jgi:hypothetical protein